MPRAKPDEVVARLDADNILRLRELDALISNPGWAWVTEKAKDRMANLRESALRVARTPDEALDRNLAIREAETISWVIRLADEELSRLDAREE